MPDTPGNRSAARQFSLVRTAGAVVAAGVTVRRATDGRGGRKAVRHAAEAKIFIGTSGVEFPAGWQPARCRRSSSSRRRAPL